MDIKVKEIKYKPLWTHSTLATVQFSLFKNIIHSGFNFTLIFDVVFPPSIFLKILTFWKGEDQTSEPLSPSKGRIALPLKAIAHTAMLFTFITPWCVGERFFFPATPEMIRKIFGRCFALWPLQLVRF